MGTQQLTREQYDALDAVNWSTLKHLAKSPIHYWFAKKYGTVDTSSKARGRVVHVATLEPEEFSRTVVVFDGKQRRGKEWDAFKAANADKEILKRSEFAQCMAIQNAVRRDPIAAPYLMRGLAEQTIEWTDPVTGIKCKGRTDWLSRALVDLKTTKNASPEGFAREAWNYGYGTQLAFYSDGLVACGEPARPVVIIAVEAAPPHPVVVYRLTDDMLERGREEYRALLSRLKGLRELGPDAFSTGYATCELDLELPRWVRDDEDDDLDGLGLDFGDQDNDDDGQEAA